MKTFPAKKTKGGDQRRFIIRLFNSVGYKQGSVTRAGYFNDYIICLRNFNLEKFPKLHNITSCYFCTYKARGSLAEPDSQLWYAEIVIKCLKVPRGVADFGGV